MKEQSEFSKKRDPFLPIPTNEERAEELRKIGLQLDLPAHFTIDGNGDRKGFVGRKLPKKFLTKTVNELNERGGVNSPSQSKGKDIK